MKILITGGLGHIGSHFLENIHKIRKIKEIHIIDNLLTNRYPTLFNYKKNKKKVFFYKMDLDVNNSLKKFKRVDVVLNLASITDAEGSLKIRNKIYKNNLGIFNNVLNYCKKNSSKLIHISSTSVYGEQKGLVDENCNNLKPKSPYAEIKLKEENILKNNNKKIKYVTFRFGTIAGISKGMRFHTAVNKFSFNVFLKKPIPVWKTMLFKHRPYLSLTDAFKVLKFTLEKDFFKNTIYNVLSENLTVADLIKYFKRNKKNIKVDYVKSKLVNQYSYKVSKDKLNKTGLLLNAKIENDIKSTIKLFKDINNEV